MYRYAYFYADQHRTRRRTRWVGVPVVFRTKGLIMQLRLKSGRRRAVVIAALTAGILGVGAGVAAAATTGHTGTSITRVSVLTQNAAVLYTGSAWTNVGTVGVYAGPGQFIDARFTAETACYGSTSGWCSV